MNIETSTDGDIFEVKFNDRLGFDDHETFRKVVQEVNDSDKKKCVFNLQNLAAIDSAGLGMFVLAKEAADKNGWSLSLTKPHGNVKNLLKLAKFDKFLTVEM
jgi:anti-anti-sigma factor